MSIHYYEHVKSNGSNRSATSSYELENPKPPVIEINHISTDERVVIVVQDDGSITSISSEGKSARRSYQIRQGSASLRLHAIQSMSLTDARASVLRGRPDISASLANNSIVISAVYSNSQGPSTAANELHFGIWILTPSVTAAYQDSLAPVTTYNLQTTSQAVVSFKSGSSKLEIQTTLSVSTFDLTTAAPQKLYERKPFVSYQTPNVELSHDISLSFSFGELLLYNSKFNSLLASTRVSTAPLKRKRDGTGLARMSFISYFSQLKRVLACSGSQLLAIDIHADDSTRNSLKHTSLLVGNILRGRNAQKGTPQTDADALDDQGLLTLSQELDDLVKSRDASGFERRLRESFSLNQWEDLKRLKPRQMKLLISKMFTVTTDDESGGAKLGLTLLSVQLLRWCIKSGILDEYVISGAFGGRTYDIPFGAVPDCLRQADESLTLLEEYIKSSPYIEPVALTLTIKSLIDQALRTPESIAAQQAPVKSIMDADGQTVLQDLSQMPGDPHTGNARSTKCLIFALRRLAFAGNATVSVQIRAAFEQKEVLALIQFLRQQLFLGGYTRSAEVQNYPSPPPSDIEGEGIVDEKPRITLDSIVTLLNGCIDSLGMIGVLVSNDDQAFIGRMIPELYSEIESATAAVEDSSYLHGLLRETLRYAESVERQPFSVRSKVERTNDVPSEKGKVVTLYTEGDTMDVGNRLPTALPLSLKAEEDISQRKIRKGGQAQPRSAREMGMLKDRLKAPYAFERLVL